MRQHAAVLGFRPEVQLGLHLDGTGEADEDDADEDVIPPELLEAVTDLSPRPLRRGGHSRQDVRGPRRDCPLPRRRQPADPGAGRPRCASWSGCCAPRTWLVARCWCSPNSPDTARYVESHLRAAGVDGLFRIDSGSKVDRAEVIRRFSPYYNASSTRGARGRRPRRDQGAGLHRRAVGGGSTSKTPPGSSTTTFTGTRCGSCSASAVWTVA